MKDIKDLPKIDDVTLPKFGSMRPGVYILALSILAILLIVFFIGFLPGILNGGKFVIFESEIDNVGVYVDNQYISGTPAQQFIKSGEHEVVYKKASQVIARDSIKVSHPVFLTYIFHRYQNVKLDLNEINQEKIDKIIKFDIQLIINQSSISEFNNVTNYIPYFSQFAKDAISFDLERENIKQYLKLASSFISSKTMLDDAINAYNYLGFDFDDEINKAKQVFQENSVNIGLPFEDKKIEATIDNLKINDSANINTLKIEPFKFVMGDTTYSTYPSINEAGIEVNLDSSFYLSKTPITNYMYSLFIIENPKWSKSNLDSLLKENLVDENYLQGISLSTNYPSLEPITNISYYAAQAFCSWLSEKTKLDIYIPSEEEWSAAAFASNNYKNNSYSTSMIAPYSIDNQFDLMLGGVWEFTSSPYFALNRIIPDRENIIAQLKKDNFNYDIIVKGGSLLNTSINVNSVGAIDKSACFEYMGFRIAYKK